MKNNLLALALLCACCPDSSNPAPEPPKIWEKIQSPSDDTWAYVYRTPTPDGWLVLVHRGGHGATAAVISDQNHAWLAPNPEKTQ